MSLRRTAPTLAAAAAVVATCACSPRPATAPPVVRVAPPSVPPPSAAIVVDAAAVALPDEPESTTEHADVNGPDGLHVAVSWQTMTGTTHTASELSITSPSGTLKFSGDDFGRDETADPLHLEPLPLVDRALGAGPHRWVLLGWSSYGGGMQSEHAWLVEDAASGPRIVDQLMWTTDRMHGGVALDLSPKLYLGFPLPDAESLHEADGWVLEHGARSLPLAQVKMLPSRETNLMTLPDFYDPPMGSEPSTRHWSGRIVWFEANAKGFVASRR